MNRTNPTVTSFPCQKAGLPYRQDITDHESLCNSDGGDIPKSFLTRKVYLVTLGCASSLASPPFQAKRTETTGALVFGGNNTMLHPFPLETHFVVVASIIVSVLRFHAAKIHPFCEIIAESLRFFYP